MTGFEATLAERMTLVDVVDHLLNKGVVLSGGAMVSLAGVDLVYLGLNVLVASVESLEERGGGPRLLPVPRGPGGGPPSVPLGAAPVGPVPGATIGPRSVAGPLSGTEGSWYADEPDAGAPTTTSDPTETGRPERELARLVLALVELLRQLLERQAVRRMEGTTLPDDAVERMGLALQALEARMAELREIFGLTEAELNLDLGPLGRLL